MKWFRLYAEIIDDPKLRNVSDKSFRVMIFLFSLAAEADKDGLIPLTEDEIMWRLRIPKKVLTAAISELSDQNIIDNIFPLQVLNWSKRQYKSDNSSNRVSAYREKRKSLGMSKGSNYDTESVLERDSHSCVYCGGTQNLCVDHVLPITQGGTDDDDNLVCACKKCNSGKAGRTPEQAGYQWRNKEACNRYIMFMSRLHETAPEQIQNRTDTDTEKKESIKKENPRSKKQFLEVVYLTDREYETLIAKYGREPTERAIEILNNAIQSKGYKYKSHYHTILGWPMEEARKNGGNGKIRPTTYAQAQDAEKRAMFALYNQLKEESNGDAENNPTGNRKAAGSLPDPSTVG